MKNLIRITIFILTAWLLCPTLADAQDKGFRIHKRQKAKTAKTTSNKSSLKASEKSAIINLYLNKIRAFKAYEDGMNYEYFLYDITNDGIPELWLIGFDLSTKSLVFTYSKGSLRKICDCDDGAHASFHRGKGYVICASGHMGIAEWTKITYSNGKIHTKTILEENINEGLDKGIDRDFTEPKEPAFNYFELTNERPIKNMFK